MVHRPTPSGAGFAALVIAAGALLGGLGIWSTAHVSEAVLAVVVGAIGSATLAANWVVNGVSAGFNKQIDRIAPLSLSKQAAFVTYIQERRRQLLRAWAIVGITGVVCGAASAGILLPQAAHALSDEAKRGLLIAAATCVGMAMPAFVRIYRFGVQLDKFGYQITEILTRRSARQETLARMSQVQH